MWKLYDVNSKVKVPINGYNCVSFYDSLILLFLHVEIFMLTCKSLTHCTQFFASLDTNVQVQCDLAITRNTCISRSLLSSLPTTQPTPFPSLIPSPPLPFNQPLHPFPGIFPSPFPFPSSFGFFPFHPSSSSFFISEHPTTFRPAFTTTVMA